MIETGGGSGSALDPSRYGRGGGAHASGEEWVWIDAAFKLVGAGFIFAGNFAYFELRAQARAAAADSATAPAPPASAPPPPPPEK